MEDFLNSIVLATDGSEDADLAARAAIDLRDETGADLHVVHVWQTAPAAFPAPVTVLRSRLPREEAAGVLEGQVERIRAGGGDVEEAHLRRGPVTGEIAAVAEEVGADLVVVGTRETGTTERFMLGSVSEEVARTAPCPTLVVRGGEGAWPPRKVVVGDDLSDEAEWAGELGARIGGLFGASALLALGFPSPGALAHADASRLRVSERMFGEGGELLRRRAIRLERLLGERPAIKVSAGDAATVIREAAGEDEEPALVAVGSRGLDALRRFALGSVSTDVLRTAGGPVLVYPAAAKRERTSVAVGSRGFGAVKRAVLGSVSAGVLKATSGPVLVAPSADERAPNGDSRRGRPRHRGRRDPALTSRNPGANEKTGGYPR